jgi:hypothetical protein
MILFLILKIFLFREHAEKAIEILSHILPEDHLLLSSSKRVKGNFTIYTCTVGICSGYQNHPRPKATNS